MTLKTEITLSDFFSGISLLLVIIGGIFAYYQWRKNISLKRANYINELTEKIRTDPLISDIVYLLDYGEQWYSDRFHSSGEFEVKMDKTLSYFSYICYLNKQSIISYKEFKFFKYEIERILVNKEIQDYFYNLYHFSEKFNVPFTFQYLFDYGKDHKFFDDEFFDANSYRTCCKYHKYLNF